MVVAELVAARPRQLAHDPEGDPDQLARTISADYFVDADGEVQDYTLAPDLTRIAVAMVEERPNDFGHLRQFDLDYLWAQTLGTTAGGEEIACKVVRLTGVGYYYARRRPQAILIWSVAFVQRARLTRWELQSLVELAIGSVWVNKDGKPKLKPIGPDQEVALARRYGPWSPRLKRLVANLNGEEEQLPLPDTDDDEEVADDDETEGGLVFAGALQ